MLRYPAEPVLESLAMLGGQSAATIILNRSWTFYQVRSQYRRALERRIQYLVGTLYGISVLDLSRLSESVFSAENFNQDLFTRQQLQAESTFDTSAYDFHERLPHSFLPEMITIAKENKISLGFIRFKRLRDTTPDSEPPELRQYMTDLRQYLEVQDSEFIDFTDDPRLEATSYADGDHLSETGQQLFTEMLAGALSEVLHEPQKSIPPR